MSSQTEISLLRKELFKTIEAVKKLQEENKAQHNTIEKLIAQNADLLLQLKTKDARLAYYENPHAPPSANSLKWRMQKSKKRKEQNSKQNESDQKKVAARLDMQVYLTAENQTKSYDTSKTFAYIATVLT